jgi:hypothetical protein
MKTIQFLLIFKYFKSFKSNNMPKLFNFLYRRPLLILKAFFFLFCLSCSAEGFAQIISDPNLFHFIQPTTTTITSSINPSTNAQSITLTATVTNGSVSNIPTGMVHFYDNGANTDLTPLGIAISNGKATFVTAPAVSTVYKATYSGDITNALDTSAIFYQNVTSTVIIIPITVGDLNPTKTTLVSSANPSIAGFPVTFTATVSTFGTFDGNDFVDFNDVTSTPKLLKTVPLLNGKATFTTSASALNSGDLQIQAYFHQTFNNQPSSSNILTQHVNLVENATGVNLTSDFVGNTANWGDSHLLTATLNSTLLALGGKVTFTDNGNFLAFVTLDSLGKANFPTNTLTPGQHAITASYFSATSDVFYLNVTPPYPIVAAPFLVYNVPKEKLICNVGVVPSAPSGGTTSFTTFISGAYYGQAVTFSGFVQSLIGADGHIITPTGTITFYESQFTILDTARSSIYDLSFKPTSTILATVPLDASGTSKFTTFLLPLGTHHIFMFYNGDAVFNGDFNSIGGTPPLLDINVVQTPAAFSVRSTINPSISGNQVPFIISLAALAPSGGAGNFIKPSGIVIFNIDGGEDQSPINLDTLTGNTVYFNIYHLGTQIITARYLGYGFYANPINITQMVSSGPATQITVGTTVPGLSFKVDGVPFTTSQTVSWASGSKHILTTSMQQTTAAGTPYGFTGWSDGTKTLSDTIAAPTTATSYTAQFQISCTPVSLTTTTLTALQTAGCGTSSLSPATFAYSTTAVTLTSTQYSPLNLPIDARSCAISKVTYIDATNLSMSSPGSLVVIRNFTITDVNGATATATQKITVTDNQAPVITTNGDKSVYNDVNVCGATVTVSASATDNCSVGAVTGVRIDGLALTAVYPVGTTTIKWNVTDVNGNAAAEVTQTVVVTDNQKPVITTNGNKNVNNDVSVCGAAVSVSASATDNCSVGTVTGVRSDALALTAVYPVGTTTIKWNVTDVNGNLAAEVIQTVMVTDNQKPVITTNGDKNVYNDVNVCGATVTVSASATDNCSVGTVTGVRSDALALNAVYTVGTTTIRWNVTDVNGNPAAEVIQTVVVTDNQKPVITTNGDKNVYNDVNVCGASVTVSASATDNCFVGTETGVRSDALALTAVYPVGTTTIKWNVSDINNNPAAEVTQTVVVTDNQKPTVFTNNISILLDVNGAAIITAAQVNNVSTDNCFIPANGYSLDKTTFNCSNVGTNTVTLTVTDVNGNKASGTAVITVLPSRVWVLDKDADGYYTGNPIIQCSSPGIGYVIKTNQQPGDCNDNDPAISPAAVEVCGNMVDDNCNGVIDEAVCYPCQNGTNLTTTNVTATSAQLSWTAIANAVQWQLEYKTIKQGSKWVDVLLTGNIRTVKLTGLLSNQNYLWHLRAKCGTIWTTYSSAIGFKTIASSLAREVPAIEDIVDAGSATIKLHPNPTTGLFNLELQLADKSFATALINLRDISGRIVYTEKTYLLKGGTLSKNITVPGNAVSGMYLVEVLVDGKVYNSKLVLIK